MQPPPRGGVAFTLSSHPELIDTVKLIQWQGFWYNVRMRKNRVIEQNRCYHPVSWLAHRAFFLDNEEKDRAVALMRRVEAGVPAIMSYCINENWGLSPLYFFPSERKHADGRHGIARKLADAVEDRHLVHSPFRIVAW